MSQATLSKRRRDFQGQANTPRYSEESPSCLYRYFSGSHALSCSIGGMTGAAGAIPWHDMIEWGHNKSSGITDSPIVIAGIGGTGAFAASILLSSVSLELSPSVDVLSMNYDRLLCATPSPTPISIPSYGRRNVTGSSLSDSVFAVLFGMAVSISSELAAKVRELLLLQSGWDGEDALPVRPTALANSVMLLRNLKLTRNDFVLPFIAPTFDGSVLLDWTSANRTLEVRPEGDEWSAVGTILHADGKKEYLSTDGQVSNVEIFYDWFRNGQLLWPAQ